MKEKKNILSKEEIEKRDAEVRKEVDKVNKRLKELQETLSDPKYSNQVYGENSMVEIPGSLFSTFVNSIQSVFNVYDSVKKNLELTINGIEYREIELSKMQIALMEQHKENIDKGNSITEEDMDKEDAKKIVKTEKEK